MTIGELAADMRTVLAPTCPVCGAAGEAALAGVTDTEFGSPGEWSYRRCTDCRSLWLDPRPHPDDLHLAYASYYTHGEHVRPPSAAKRVLARLPHHGDDVPGATAWLGRVAPGRMVDVGCGDGRTMRALEELGWRVEGYELDPVSVDECRRQGLDVTLGSITEHTDLDDRAADAVVCSHVIEHVEDPAAFARALRRLVRPGGHVCVITPNPDGRLAARDGAHWRGLEAPRHLQLLPGDALTSVLADAGFEIEHCFTSARGTNGMSRSARRSRRGERGGRGAAVVDLLIGEIDQMISWDALRRGRAEGDELVVRAIAR